METSSLADPFEPSDSKSKESSKIQLVNGHKHHKKHKKHHKKEVEEESDDESDGTIPDMVQIS